MSLVAEKPIDGTLPDDLSTPIGALNEFYRAFNGRDLALMKQNWEQAQQAAMDKALGGLKRGWSEIESVYERIFAGAVTVRVGFSTTHCIKLAKSLGSWARAGNAEARRD